MASNFIFFSLISFVISGFFFASVSRRQFLRRHETFDNCGEIAGQKSRDRLLTVLGVILFFTGISLMVAGSYM